MNLKDFLASREKPPELLWSLVLENGWVQAGIWNIKDSEAEVLSVSPPTPWEVDDDLVGATDAALSSAVQKLPEDYPEPSKTVFGVPSSWVKEGEISEAYLAKIKKICADLSLNPVGFVVLTEAIAHLYKSEEGAPVSAIIVGLGKESLEISVFKLGNLVGSTSVSRSVSLIEDVTEGLSRFDGASPLPSRFIVFDGKGGELEEAKELLMQEPWDETGKIKFLHTPKVETLNSDRKVFATSLAGANEIGNVSKVTSKDIQENKITDETPVSEVEKMGEEVVNVHLPKEDVSPEDLGFSINEDVTVSNSPVAKAFQEAPKQAVVFEQTTPSIKINQPLIDSKIGSYVKRTKSLFHDLTRKVIPTKTISNKPSKNPLIALGVFLLILIVGGGLFWWFYPKADVTIYVTPKSFQEDVNITFDTSGQGNATGGAIPAQALTTQVSGEKTKATSGTKLIGDKAKGSVVVTNWTGNDITLSSGTLLVSSAGLDFTVDNSASISATVDNYNPNTTTVSVTSSDIGSQYNLAKGEIFRVGNFSKNNVSAQASTDFSGGSSQQIAAVSKDDQSTLENQLKDELTAKAKDTLSTQANDSQIFVTDLAATNITSENFDNKVGDQADSLKLDLALNVTGLAADKSKLLEFARNSLRDKIPAGFVLRDSQISFNFTFVSQKVNSYVYKVTLSANFLPEVNTDAIIQKIAGKTPSVTESYLTSIPGFTRADVTLKPRLPGPFGTLPRISKNITVEVVAER